MEILILHKLISRFDAIFIKISADLFEKSDKLIQKIHEEIQCTQNSQNNVKNDLIGELTLPNIKAYYNPEAIKTA